MVFVKKISILALSSMLFWLVLISLNASSALAACNPGGGLGGPGGAPQTNGTDGNCTTDGGAGGGGAGGGGSASGGNGGNGAGGGVMLKNTSGTMTISGTIDNRGGGASTTNGGTVKLFYTGTAPSTGGISSGRTYTAAYTPNSTPAAPTLTAPLNAAVQVRGYPIFKLKTTDDDEDYVQYKIELCSNNTCGVIIRTIEQSESQTSWINQDAGGNTGYFAGVILEDSTEGVYTLIHPGLTANTQYWWRAYAKDPGGTNIYSSASSIYSFTVSPVVDINVRGGSNIRGGSRIN